MPEDWSRTEVEATVADYFVMLDLELRDQPYVKQEHIRQLAQVLNGRSGQAIQYKYANVSAVLRELGLPFVDGFKPYSNYQQLLFEVVSDRVSHDLPLLTLVREQVEAPPTVPELEDILSALVEAPKLSADEEYPEPRRVLYRGSFRPVDYLQREASNQKLGAAGEEFVMRFERARLLAAGRERLAERIERVSNTQGDWLGFDIKSYESDGSDRFIEVKTTRYGKRTPFYVSRNELNTSLEHGERYHLFRVFRFHQKPNLFSLAGRLDHVAHLDAVNFMARVD